MSDENIGKDGILGNPNGRHVYAVITRGKLYHTRADSKKEAAEFYKGPDTVHVCPLNGITSFRWPEPKRMSKFNRGDKP
jgi:hypothetical protein